MRSLIFVLFSTILMAIGLIAVMNMQTEPIGLIIEKPFIPESTIQDMAYDSLQRAIEDNKTALIFFYENTCDLCISQIAEIESMLEHLNSTNPNIFKTFTYYEYDFNTGLRNKFGVTRDHTLILIKEGKEVLRTREALTKEQLLERIES